MSTKHIQEIVERLKAIAEFPTVGIHKDWVQVVMSQFRQHVEAAGLRNKYKVLMFYCNWNLHPELDRGIVQDFLKKISGVINDDRAGHPTDRISEILSMAKLRNEIREVLKNEGHESGVFEIDKNWIAFTELMFPFLLDKPLRRKGEVKTPHWVESLELYDNVGKLFWRIQVMPESHESVGPVLRTDP